MASEHTVTETRSVSWRSRSAPLPLSVSQTRLWYLSQLAPDSPACNELITIRKTGPLDMEALRRALTEVVARREAWRTTFEPLTVCAHEFVHGQSWLPRTDMSHLGLKTPLIGEPSRRLCRLSARFLHSLQ